MTCTSFDRSQPEDLPLQAAGSCTPPNVAAISRSDNDSIIAAGFMRSEANSVDARTPVAVTFTL